MVCFLYACMFEKCHCNSKYLNFTSEIVIESLLSGALSRVIKRFYILSAFLQFFFTHFEVGLFFTEVEIKYKTRAKQNS